MVGLFMLRRGSSYNRCKLINLSTYYITLIKHYHLLPLFFSSCIVKMAGFLCSLLLTTNSNFSLVSIHFAVSTAYLRFSFGNSTQYKYDCRGFLNTSQCFISSLAAANTQLQSVQNPIKVVT